MVIIIQLPVSIRKVVVFIVLVVICVMIRPALVLIMLARIIVICIVKILKPLV